MKRMKLFPKTFLYTLFMLLIITLSMHLMIYFFYPKVYLNRMQHNLENRLENLQQEIKEKTEAEAGQTFLNFAKENNVNVTVGENGSEKTYLGMNFKISFYADTDTVFSVSNLDIAESIIVINKTMDTKDGKSLQIKLIASAKPVKEAVDMITFLLPWTFTASIAFSVLFSYFYSKRITKPILNMLAVTNDMKNLKPDAAFHISDEDEMGILAEQINQVYECLLSTIQSLDKEKEHLVEVEKAKTVFLRSASHELKTPLAGLRILLENMQYGVGKYKDHEKYLAEAVDMVDELNGMVKDILDTSKVQEMAPEKTKLIVKEELERVLKEYELQMTEKSLAVSTDAVQSVTVYMRAQAFEKVWSNLIGNAVKYTKEAGRITIGADEKKMWIENTCAPIEAEQLQYIYEPFYRPSQTRNVPGGNGLGLYVVSELLKKEGCAYTFEPFEEGMRFTIYL